MPNDRPFIDSHAIHGGKHDSMSRTIASRDKRKIKLRYDISTDRFYLDMPDYKNIKISGKHMLKLSRWIYELYGTWMPEIHQTDRRVRKR